MTHEKMKKLTYNFHSKRFWATFIAVVILNLIFLTPLISGFEFDNIKRYNTETKTITVENAFGLGEDIASVQLLTPLENYVKVGEDILVAEFKITNYKDYSNAFKELEFYNINEGMKKIDRVFEYRVLVNKSRVVDNYDVDEKCMLNKDKSNYRDCYTFSNSYLEYYQDWELITKSNFLEGDIKTIGIFTDTKDGDYIEWIPNLYGVRVEEWATFIASSVTKSIDGDYTVYTYTSNGYFNTTGDTIQTEVLLVGGGGGTQSGTQRDGAGGGAGGLLHGEAINVTVGNYIVIVGVGGNPEANGTVSSFFSMTALGGGTGGEAFISGDEGGSGGGGANFQATIGYGVQGNSGDALGFGNNGGTGFAGGGVYGAGGGGGANAVGENGATDKGGDGGDGLDYDINGTTVCYAGGGGGGIQGVGTAGLGACGGGNGNSNGGAGFSAINGTGSGAGGYGQVSEGNSRQGARGGDGVIIIRVKTSDIAIPLSPTIESLLPINNTNRTSGSFVFSGVVFDDLKVQNVSLILDGVINETNTAGTNNTNYTFTKVIREGIHEWYFTAFDNDSQETNSSAMFVNVSYILPTIEDLLPANNTNRTTNSVTFNGVVFDDVAVQNVSLFIDGVLNDTDTAGTNNTNYTFTEILSEGIHSWEYRAFDSYGNFTDSGLFFVNLSFVLPTVTLSLPINNTNSSTQSIHFNSTVFDDIGLINVSLIINEVVNDTDTSGLNNTVYGFDEILADGSYNWTMRAVDTYGNITTAGIYLLSVDTSTPEVNVFSPNSSVPFHEISTNLFINWTANDTNIESCIYNWNTTNITVPCIDNQTTINIVDYTKTDLTFWVEDVFGNMNTTFISWDYRLFLFSETFTATVTEGFSNIFEMELITNGSDITLANLSYNAQQNIGTITETATDNFTISRTMVSPAVTTNTSFAFFWDITQGTFDYTFASQNQKVVNLDIDNCTNNTFVIYNFTMVDEATQVIMPVGNPNTTVNTSGKVDIQVWSVDRTTSLDNLSAFYNKTNPFAVCLNQTFAAGEEFVMDVQVEYNADDYESEFYHLQNETLSSSVLYTNISLYDLLTTSSQVFKLIARDTSYLALGNAVIEVQRKYIDEGVFKIVEIPLTDAQGETTAHLVLNDVIYNFIIKRFGETILSVNNVIPVCQTPLVTTCKIEFNAFSTDVDVPDFESAADFNYTLGYNSSSRVVSSVFSIPSGNPSLVTLTVIREDALGTAVCTDSLTSDSGTLSCIVPNSFGNTTVLAEITRDGVFVAKGNIKLDQDPSDIYGTSLLFLGLFVMLTLIGASMSDNPVFTIIFMMLGIILLFAINLVANNGFIGGTATILWLIVAIIIIIIKGARRN